MSTAKKARSAVAADPKNIDDVSVSHLFLHLTNPRHDPMDSEPRAIARLCAKENVYPLARDIAKIGLNPLERFALIPVNKKNTTGANARYHVAEGNRRICAIKLLNDPDLAPPNLRKQFRKLADDWTPIKTVAGTVFENMDAVRTWLDRIHNGPQGGVGRKQWNSEQKTRFDGGNKNTAAQALLDYAEGAKMLTATERAGKLTTVQRFLSNQLFREAIGFDQSNPNDVGRTRPKSEFDVVVKRFIRDLVDQESVNSRMNKDEIIQYSRPLSSLPGVTATRIEPESLSVSDSGKGKRRNRKPHKPEKTKFIQHENAIATALTALANKKLSSLYYSICSIELDQHTPIVSVGVWAFFETLTACAGRTDSTSFDSFLSKDKLRQFGLEPDTKAIRQAAERISAYGNTTKHHSTSATFNGDQLNNDVTTLKSVILKCIEIAAGSTT